MNRRAERRQKRKDDNKVSKISQQKVNLNQLKIPFQTRDSRQEF